MARVTHSARITGPVIYLADGGERLKIPLGPCLLEEDDAGSVDVIWGTQGENSAALAAAEIENAEESGHLLLLD